VPDAAAMRACVRARVRGCVGGWVQVWKRQQPPMEHYVELLEQEGFGAAPTLVVPCTQPELTGSTLSDVAPMLVTTLRAARRLSTGVEVSCEVAEFPATLEREWWLEMVVSAITAPRSSHRAHTPPHPATLHASLRETVIVQGNRFWSTFSHFSDEELESVSRPFPSWNRFILTEIYLCHACSCQEILRTETAGQGIAEIRSEHAGPTISFTEQMVFITARVVCGDTL
jgi:hypothetical protein